MDQKSPKEKLQEACGVQNSVVPSRPVQDQESRKYYQALLDRAENASAWAQLAQDQTEQSYRRLNNYIHEELPKHLVRAFEQVAEKAVLDTLGPLDQGVRRAAGTANEIGRELRSWIWFWMRDIIICAISIGLATGALVYYTLYAKLDRMNNARRYELWGRSVEQKIALQPPEERKKLRALLGTPKDAAGK